MTLLTKLTEYSISQRLGQIEESATAKTKDFSTIFSPDQNVEINVAGGYRSFFITKARRDIKLNDIAQSLECVSHIAKYAKKAHTKTLTYITMTAQEYMDFMESNPDIGRLDYIPFIRLGNDIGENGWSMQQIITDLAQWMGVSVHCSLPSYWIKQFSVFLGESYWQAIFSLVSPLRPQIFSVGGRIFIMGDIGAINLGISSNIFFPNARLVSEEVVRPENPFLLRTGGDLGFFRPEKHKGKVSTDYRDFTEYFGNVMAEFSAYGYEEEISETETGDLFTLTEAERDTDTGMLDGYTKEIITQGYGLDAFGKRAFSVGETRDIYKFQGAFYSDGTPIEGVWSLVLFRRESKANTLKNTHLRYLSPIETNREETVDAMVWNQDIAGDPIFDFYEKLKEKETKFIYDKDMLTGKSKGILLTQATYEKGLTYTEDEKEFRPLEVMQKDDISNIGKIQRRATFSEVINYTQHTKDSYGVRRVASFLGQDGKYKTESGMQVVQAGAIQGEREQFRKMPVYAEATIGGTAPPKEIRIPTPSWESIELLTMYLALFENAVEIYRTYEIPDELNVHLGLQVTMGAVTHPCGVQIPAPILAPGFRPVIVAYEIKNSLMNKSTTMVVKGRLN